MPFPPITAHPPPLPLNRPPIDLLNKTTAVQPPIQPLFPAAINATSSFNNDLNSIANKSRPVTEQPINNQQTSTVTNGTLPAPVLIVNPANGKILHPEEDISLEEHRARLPKYKSKINSSMVHNLLENYMIPSSNSLIKTESTSLGQPNLLSNSTLNNNVINNYTRSYVNDNLNNDSSISQPCYQTPINDHSSRNYYRKN